MNKTAETAQNILNVPLDAQIWARKMHWQADWTDYDTGSVADLQMMARFWLACKELTRDIDGIKNVGFTSRYGINLLKLGERLKEIENEA
jgi:hypothetical protein